MWSRGSGQGCYERKGSDARLLMLETTARMPRGLDGKSVTTLDLGVVADWQTGILVGKTTERGQTQLRSNGRVIGPAPRTLELRLSAGIRPVSWCVA